jgi:hypothetical protein
VPPTYCSPSKLVFGIALTTLAALMSLSVALAQPQAKKPRARAAPCQRFASPRGEDSNRGTKKSPFETAARLARALKAGQTGCLLAGRFTGNVGISGRGRPGLLITLRAAPGAKATICGVQFQPGADYWRLSGLSIDGSCSTQWFTVQIYADHVTLDHDDVTNHHRAGSCVLIGGHVRDGGVAPNAWLHHDRIHDCGSTTTGPASHGIYAAAARSARVTDSYIYGNSGYGIQLYPDAQGTLVERNVIDGNSTKSGLVFAGRSPYASSNNVVTENIFTRNGMFGITASWGGQVGTGNLVKANCFWANSKGAFNRDSVGFVRKRNLEANPNFVSAPSGDYRMHRKSPCRAMRPRGRVGPQG